MSRKNRKKDMVSRSTLFGGWPPQCHAPKFVKAGDHRIFICDHFHYKERQYIDTIQSLDLFIGLDYCWSDMMIPYGVNPLVKRMHQRLKGGLTNLYVHHIQDLSIDTILGQEILLLLADKVRLGFGCMGGHGRTGWLLGYLIKKLEDLSGEILLKTIRDRLCSEALEGLTQFENLGLREFYQSKSLWSSGGPLTVYRPKKTKEVDTSKIYQPCPLCEGTGKREDCLNGTCQLCGGTGLIEEYIDVQDFKGNDEKSS